MQLKVENFTNARLKGLSLSMFELWVISGPITYFFKQNSWLELNRKSSKELRNRLEIDSMQTADYEEMFEKAWSCGEEGRWWLGESVSKLVGIWWIWRSMTRKTWTCNKQHFTDTGKFYDCFSYYVCCRGQERDRERERGCCMTGLSGRSEAVKLSRWKLYKHGKQQSLICWYDV